MGKRNAFEPDAAASRAKDKSRNTATNVVAKNPFERRFVKAKHAVINRKNTHEQQAPNGQLRSQANEVRKATLLVDHQNRFKANSFEDRRFGEKEGMSQEDKMLLRFQKERMAAFRKESKFQLSDEGFTHNGLPLDLQQKFQAPREDEEHDEDTAFNKQLTNQYNFGGGAGDEEENRHKTKKEVMQEVIAKSKFYKAERQKEQQQQNDLLEQLDEDFSSIRDLLGGQQAESKYVPPKADEFDKLTKELGFDLRAKVRAHARACTLARDTDGRAKVGERLKTPEEIATAEVDSLKRLEARLLIAQSHVAACVFYHLGINRHSGCGE